MSNELFGTGSQGGEDREREKEAETVLEEQW